MKNFDCVRKTNVSFEVHGFIMNDDTKTYVCKKHNKILYANDIDARAGCNLVRQLCCLEAVASCCAFRVSSPWAMG